MDQSYRTSEKLKSKVLLSALFSEGRSVYRFPVKMIFLPMENQEKYHKAGVSVPKRNFKKATDRNYLKRLMREAYRKNKYLAPEEPKFAIFFIFTGRQKEDFKKVNSAIEFLLKKMNSAEI